MTKRKWTFWTQSLEDNAWRKPWLRFLMRMYYRSIVKNEIKLAEINANDKVLCIGGGAFPITAMLIQEMTGAQVTVAERDPTCFYCAQKMLQDSPYNISLVLADGKKICPKAFSVILLASQVAPIEKVIRHIVDQSSVQSRILVREARYCAKESFFQRDICLEQLGGVSVSHSLVCNLERTILYDHA